MKRIQILPVLLALSCLTALRGISQQYESNWSSLDQRPVPQWFPDAKFGIFIHWGIYSVPAWAPANTNVSVYDKYAEWYWQRINTPMDKNEDLNKVRKLFTDYHHQTWGKNFRYQDFAPLFKAEHFNPDDWANLFKAAGAKYVVLTSKHHEGFTMWPSKESWNWNAMDIGPHRDLCGDLSKAVKDKGLHMGFYYSLYEWFNPLYQSNLDKYVDDHMLPQLKDLVVRYQPDLVWTDGEWDHPSDKWKSTEYLSWLFNESPVKNTVVVNDRWGKETRGKHGSFFTTEYDHVHDAKAIGKMERPWEECRGIGSSFGYNRSENLEHYQSSEALVHVLIQKVAAGGNLLLNVGPTADGRIPVIMQQRLLDMGGWLKVNGEAIYGSSAPNLSGLNANAAGVYFTRKGKDLYAIVTRWTDQPVKISGVGRAKAVSLLGFNGKINFRAAGNSITIHPPALSPSTNPCQYAWVFKLSDAL